MDVAGKHSKPEPIKKIVPENNFDQELSDKVSNVLNVKDKYTLIRENGALAWFVNEKGNIMTIPVEKLHATK